MPAIRRLTGSLGKRPTADHKQAAIINSGQDAAAIGAEVHSETDALIAHNGEV